jgi:pilus assembly protein FimV
MTRQLQRLAGLIVLLSPATAFALGLGEIELHSALNEPLSAEIELVSAAPDELSSLKASLANRETFTRYGLDRPAFLNSIEFKVGRSGDGRNVLQVRSREAASEPFLSFLVEVNWSRGRLLREYTLLLDPPVYMPGPERTEAAPVAAPQAGVTETERSGAVQRPVEPEPAMPEPQAAEPAPSASRPVEPAMIEGANYTVRNNDTLWHIASGLKPGAASGINRMMLALYRANPEAFSGNINQLRAGAILRIPQDAEFEGIAPSEANAEVRRQYAEWRATRGLGEEGAAPSDARLRLVTPEEGGEGAAPAAVPGPEATALRDRVGQLETQLEESRRAIELRDQELARLQQQLGQQPGAAEPAPEPTVEPTPEQPQPEVAGAAPTETTEPPVAEPTPAIEPEAAAPAPEVSPAPAPARKAAGPSWIDWLLGHWYYPLAVVLILGGIIFGLKRRRSEPDFASFGKLAAAAGTAAREPRIERETTAAPVRTAAKAVEDTFLVEESGEREQPRFAAPAPEPVRAEKAKPEPARRSADETLSSETAINLDQGDPLAEADFHMAYGLYDQAADLVRIAIEREPQRRDLKLKLLEIFFVWGNKDAFLQSARQLAESRGEAPAGEWEKIAIMGRQISPDDPLFAAGGGRPGAAAADVDLNLEGGENRVDLDLIGPAEGTHAGGIDLDLGHAAGEDQTAVTGESPALREGEVGLDFVVDTGRHRDTSATTREMTARTMETPTIETEAFGAGAESPTVELGGLRGRDSTTIREKLNAAMLRDAAPPDQTAELALDDLGLELDQLPDAEEGSLSDLEETDHPADAPTMLAGMDEKSRRVMESAEPSTRGRDLEPTRRSKTLTGEEKISPTGTWVLDDKTLAATVALPGSGRGDTSSTQDRVRALAKAAGRGTSDTGARRKPDVESTAEVPGLAGEEMDLDLDRLESALKSDTVKQQRKGSSAEDRFATDVFGAKDMAATDLDLDVGEVKRDRDRAPTGTARIPADEMGLPELEPVTMSEVGTKLDLARAYMDMGDPEGARSILEEVLQEGSATQKQEAQRLIESLPG